MAAFALLAASRPPSPVTAVLISAPVPSVTLAPDPIVPVSAPVPVPVVRSLGAEERAPAAVAEPAQESSPDLDLIIPVADVPASDLEDTWGAARSAGRRHRGIDIMAPQGREIFAAADGVLVRMDWNSLGGRTIYQRDASGEFILYYAHLDGYAPGLEAGATVRRGDLIGYVGSTGNATTPHLHFEIMRQPNLKRWWGGTSFNPYRVLKRAAENS